MADYNREPGNIIRMQTRPKLNIVSFIIISVFIFTLVQFINMVRMTHTSRYEVVEGSLASSTIYRGIIIRDESIFTCQNPGYVNFLAREGQRVAVGDLIYTVDETGSLNDILTNAALEDNTLTDKELEDFRSDIVDYSHYYNSNSFDSVYDFKYSLKNTVAKLNNSKLLGNINDAANSNTVKYCYSSDTGIIGYYIDGFENLTGQAVNKDMFDEKKYERTQFFSNELRATGENIYKLATNENWSVVFPINKNVGEELVQEGYVQVRFLKNQDKSWGKVTLLENEDGTYLQLSFTNSMVNFVSERYIDIELLLSDESGLKIPLSSIVEKDFFIIDEDFVLQDASGYHIKMQTYKEDGTKSLEKINVSVYSYDNEKKTYYIDDSFVTNGSTLYDETGERTFVVKAKGTLIGVYNINKGYADFKEITILYSNDEYAIVKSNTTYGLRVYDYIALDAKGVEDDQFINQ